MRRAGKWLLTLAMVWAALLNGAVEFWALIPVALATAAAAVLVAWRAEPKQPRRGASLLFWLVVGLTAYTALQAIPVPASVARVLSPHAADVWQRALHPLAMPGPAWHPLSLDPGATRVQILRGATYVAMFFCALLLSGAAERAFLERVLVVVSLLVAVGAVAHIGFDAHRLWGFYAPRTGVGMIAPFFNHNQLSGFLNIGLLVAAGSTVAAEPVMPRSLSAAAVLGLAAMVVFLGSRGAVGSAIVGLVIVCALSWRSRGFRRHARIALPLVVASAGVGMLAFASHDASSRNLQNGDFSKLLVTKISLLAMAPRYPVFGVGRGSFESTFPEFRHDPGWFVFTHPENLIAQWVTEWGIPVAVAALIICVVALRPRAVMARSRPAIGAFAALVALFLQNLVDFSSEFPGVVMALTVCAALVVGGSGGRKISDRSRLSVWSLMPRRSGQIIFAGVLVSLGAACIGAGHDLLSDRERVRARGDRGRDDDRDVIDSIRAHPAEPYFAYVAAARAAAENNGRVVAWVDRALERAPVYGPAHLVLARWLRTRSAGQSRLEYRVAQEQGGVDVPIGELARMVHGYYDALELAPSGENGVQLLDRLSQAIASSEPSSAERIDAEILRRHPSSVSVLTRAANDDWADVRDEEPWCPRCELDAERAAHALEVAAPDRCDGYIIGARVLIHQGQPAAGLEHLRAGADHAQDPPRCFEQLARLAIGAHEDEEASQAIARLAGYPCAGADECARRLLVAAELEKLRHSPNRALVYLRRAASAAPGREDVLAAEASTAAALGMHAEAQEVYRELLALHPENPAYRAGAAANAATTHPGLP